MAAFYKKLGILDQQKATSQYWPVSFSDTKELNLLRGRLEPERIIVFEEEMVERKRKWGLINDKFIEIARILFFGMDNG